MTTDWLCSVFIKFTVNAFTRKNDDDDNIIMMLLGGRQESLCAVSDVCLYDHHDVTTQQTIGRE